MMLQFCQCFNLPSSNPATTQLPLAPSLHAMEVAYQQYMQAEYVRMDATFNTSQLCPTAVGCRFCEAEGSGVKQYFSWGMKYAWGVASPRWFLSRGKWVQGLKTY